MVPHWPSMSFGFWKPPVDVNHHHPRACLLPAGAEGGRGYSRTSTRPAAGHGSQRARRRRVGLAASPARHKAAGATTLESPGGGKAVLAPVPAGVCQWRPRPNASRLISRAINRIWCPSCGPRHAARRNIWPRAARSRRDISTPQRQPTAAPGRAEAQQGRRTSCALDWQKPCPVAILVDPHFVRSAGAASPSRSKTQKGLPSFSREIVALLKRPDVRRLLTSVAAREAGGGRRVRVRAPEREATALEPAPALRNPLATSRSPIRRATTARRAATGTNPASTRKRASPSCVLGASARGAKALTPPPPAKKKKPKARGGANHANEDEEPDAAKDSPSRSDVVGALSEALDALFVSEGVTTTTVAVPPPSRVGGVFSREHAAVPAPSSQSPVAHAPAPGLDAEIYALPSDIVRARFSVIEFGQTRGSAPLGRDADGHPVIAAAIDSASSLSMVRRDFAVNIRPADRPRSIRTSCGTFALDTVGDVLLPHDRTLTGFRIVRGVYLAPDERLPRGCQALFGRRAIADLRLDVLAMCALPLTRRDPLPLYAYTPLDRPATHVCATQDGRSLPVFWDGKAEGSATACAAIRIRLPTCVSPVCASPATAPPLSWASAASPSRLPLSASSRDTSCPPLEAAPRAATLTLRPPLRRSSSRRLLAPLRRVASLPFPRSPLRARPAILALPSRRLRP